MFRVLRSFRQLVRTLLVLPHALIQLPGLLVQSQSLQRETNLLLRELIVGMTGQPRETIETPVTIQVPPPSTPIVDPSFTLDPLTRTATSYPIPSPEPPRSRRIYTDRDVTVVTRETLIAQQRLQHESEGVHAREGMRIVE